MSIQQVRSIFLSDIHLGTKACQAGHLLDFLKAYSSEYVFLLGDIVDLWAMSRGGVHWSPDQNTFVQKMLRRARHGEKVIFIPGNHDEAMREYIGTSFGDVMVMHDYIHTAADGRRYLLIHGDEFDQRKALSIALLSIPHDDHRLLIVHPYPHTSHLTPLNG